MRMLFGIDHDNAGEWNWGALESHVADIGPEVRDFFIVCLSGEDECRKAPG
jgi:hypothetical protein